MTNSLAWPHDNGRHYPGSGDLDPTPDCLFCLFDRDVDLFDDAFVEQLQTWAREVAQTGLDRSNPAWQKFASWLHGKAQRVRDERALAAFEGGAP